MEQHEYLIRVNDVLIGRGFRPLLTMEREILWECYATNRPARLCAGRVIVARNESELGKYDGELEALLIG